MPGFAARGGGGVRRAPSRVVALHSVATRIGCTAFVSRANSVGEIPKGPDCSTSSSAGENDTYLGILADEAWDEVQLSNGQQQ